MKKNRRILKVTLVIILLGGVVALPILFGVFRQSTVPPEVEQPLTAKQMTALIPKGRELAYAGDCFGCHSLPDGAMGSGGVAIDTPFGTVHSTNITPDKTFGIGNYTRADFHRAIKYGIAKEKGNLYPAMPFVFTHITTTEDIDALYAYMMSIPALPVANKSNTGVFMLPVRPFMNFWTLLNFPDRGVPHNAERSKDWNRGAYLVEGLAHCGACHSPRNFMMGIEFDHALEGGSVDDMAIPNITAEVLSQRGSNVATLSEYLQTGISPQGTSFAGMNTVTHFSTSNMNPEDIKAIATYLLTDKNGKLLEAQLPPESLTETIDFQSSDMMEQGRFYYISACSGCHGLNGEGTPYVAPALKGNAILAMDRPQTLIATVIGGLSTTTYTHGQRMYAMPSFSGRMDAQSIAKLLSWVRAEWGGQATAITPAQVEAQEKQMSH